MTYWGIFTAKPMHSHAVFMLWVYIPTHLPLTHPFHSHWTNFPWTLLGVTSQNVWHIRYAIDAAIRNTFLKCVCGMSPLQTRRLLPRIGNFFPKSAGFVHTYVSETWCSFAYVSSAFAFRPSAFAFRSSAFAFVSEFRPSNRRVFELRHQL